MASPEEDAPAAEIQVGQSQEEVPADIADSNLEHPDVSGDIPTGGFMHRQ